MSGVVFYPVVVEKADKASFDARFVMSAASPDRVRDTIDPDAYKAAIAGVKKLMALWMHNPEQPIGYWADMVASKSDLTGYIKLADTGTGNFVKQLLKDEVPVGASVSFRGKGQFNEQGGIHYTTISLLECSIVSVPAHPKAIQIAKAFGIELPSNALDTNASGMSARELQIRMNAVQAESAARRILKGSRS